MCERVAIDRLQRESESHDLGQAARATSAAPVYFKPMKIAMPPALCEKVIKLNLCEWLQLGSWVIMGCQYGINNKNEAKEPKIKYFKPIKYEKIKNLKSEKKILLYLNKYIERWIREYPEQWIWVHNRWKN